MSKLNDRKERDQELVDEGPAPPPAPAPPPPLTPPKKQTREEKLEDACVRLARLAAPYRAQETKLILDEVALLGRV